MQTEILDQEILTAQTLKYFPKSVAKKYIVSSAEKDLEVVKKAQKSLKNLMDLGMIENNDEHCDFKGLLRDCRKQLESIIENPFVECGDDSSEKHWSIENYCFSTGIYDDCDFDFVKLWAKLVSNTKKCLETMGAEVEWGTEGQSGSF